MGEDCLPRNHHIFHASLSPTRSSHFRSHGSRSQNQHGSAPQSAQPEQSHQCTQAVHLRTSVEGSIRDSLILALLQPPQTRLGAVSLQQPGSPSPSDCVSLFIMDLKILSTTVNDVFLHPQVRSENETPEEHEAAIVQIIIQLSIPAKTTPPSKLLSLTASLIGYESIGFPKGGFEQNQPYYNKKSIASATDLKLEAGSIYQFEVSFRVDNSTAAYQRCKYGRHHQKVQVKATFPGLIGKKTLLAEKNLFFVQTVASQGFLPYYHVHRGVEEGLGPIFLGSELSISPWAATSASPSRSTVQARLYSCTRLSWHSCNRQRSNPACGATM